VVLISLDGRDYDVCVVCQVTAGGGSVDEEVKRVQAECHYLSDEIRRLREDNSKLRVCQALFLLESCHACIDLVEYGLTSHSTHYRSFRIPWGG